jgi:DNA-binding HxlR family transcriptional regulator
MGIHLIPIAYYNQLQIRFTGATMQPVFRGAFFSENDVNEHRSGCPINLTLEIVGDKWSLLILRDIMFGGKRHFRELLTKSQERIASNILADRLRTLVEQGILTRADDPSHKQKAIYSLTEKGIELFPVLAQMAVWGRKHLPVSEELGIRAQLLDEGGPALWQDFMADLRETHLGAPPRRRPKSGGLSVAGQLQLAYEAVAAKRKKTVKRP